MESYYHHFIKPPHTPHLPSPLMLVPGFGAFRVCQITFLSPGAREEGPACAVPRAHHRFSVRTGLGRLELDLGLDGMNPPRLPELTVAVPRGLLPSWPCKQFLREGLYWDMMKCPGAPQRPQPQLGGSNTEISLLEALRLFILSCFQLRIQKK